jgi:hypothetical protein
MRNLRQCECSARPEKSAPIGREVQAWVHRLEFPAPVVAPFHYWVLASPFHAFYQAWTRSPQPWAPAEVSSGRYRLAASHRSPIRRAPRPLQWRSTMESASSPDIPPMPPSLFQQLQKPPAFSVKAGLAHKGQFWPGAFYFSQADSIVSFLRAGFFQRGEKFPGPRQH